MIAPAQTTVSLSPNLQAILAAAIADLVQQLVRGELATAPLRGASLESPWMTPPAAARLTRVPVKTIRAWVRDGRITKRLKNRSADPKQQKYLVNVEEVIAAAEQSGSSGSSGSATGSATDVQARAQEILAARAAKGR